MGGDSPLRSLPLALAIPNSLAMHNPQTHELMRSSYVAGSPFFARSSTGQYLYFNTLVKLTSDPTKAQTFTLSANGQLTIGSTGSE